MKSFRQSVVLHGIYAALLLLTAYMLNPVMHSAPGQAPLHRHLTAWMVVTLVSITLPILWHLFMITRGFRRDAKLLRMAILQLESRDKKVPLNTFNFEELGRCGEELSRVAEWLQKEQDRLTEHASHDSLTGLPNRRFLIDTLSREIRVAQRGGWPLSLIMVDLDHFKDLNDTYGHPTGDAVLKHAAERMASLVRRSDVVARFGGEEFAIILPRADVSKAVEIAWQLRNALRCDVITIGAHSLHTSASFGVAELHTCHASQPECLIKYSDMALYQAKKNGRDTVEVAYPITDAENGGEKTEPGPAIMSGGMTKDNTDRRTDANTILPMGSTFSIMQVLPDKHRAAHDTVQQVVGTLGCEKVVLAVFDKQRDDLVPIASSGTPAWETGDATPMTDGLAQWVFDLRSSQTAFSPRHVELTIVDDTFNAASVRVVRIPLIAHSELIGVLEATCLSADFEVGERQRQLLSAVCLIGATALRICDLFAEQEDRWTGLVEALCHVIDADDVYKRDHAKCVSRLVVKIARVLGQTDEEELRLLHTAGLVHDIGQIAVPRQIREKAGNLRNKEWELVQDHCRVGADLLAKIPHMDRMAGFVLHHHERFDGTGYPDQLQGDAIPLESRILAVADSYHAMTSDRPFRRALSHREAVERILLGSGGQFDPMVVDALLVCLGETAGNGKPAPRAGLELPRGSFPPVPDPNDLLPQQSFGTA